jgi:hypothetical protein
MINMIARIIPAVTLLVLFTQCKQEGVLADVQVVSGPGGARMSYSFAPGDTLHYVLARYVMSATRMGQAFGKCGRDTLVLDGFEHSRDYPVTLYILDSTHTLHDSVTLTVHPDLPYYETIRASLKLVSDQEGVNIHARNPASQPVEIILLTPDSITHRLEVEDIYTSHAEILQWSWRGRSATPGVFGVCVKDRFGNVSDTLITSP